MKSKEVNVEVLWVAWMKVNKTAIVEKVRGGHPGIQVFRNEGKITCYKSLEIPMRNQKSRTP